MDDRTVHLFSDLAHVEGKWGFIPHNENWYSVWGGKCPVCGVMPVFKGKRRG